MSGTYRYDIQADALVAINKSVIGDQRIAEPRAFFFLGRVVFLIPETRKRSLQCRIQQSLIAHADAAARCLCQKLMEQ